MEPIERSINFIVIIEQTVWLQHSNLEQLTLFLCTCIVSSANEDFRSIYLMTLLRKIR